MTSSGIVANPAKTMVLPLEINLLRRRRVRPFRPEKDHAPTKEETSLFESFDVCIAEEGGAPVVAVPIGSVEYVVERAVGAGVRDGGDDRFARCLVDMPEKQAAALIAIGSLGQKEKLRRLAGSG